MPQTLQVKFSVNIWTHLYSLSQAIKYQNDNSGRRLLIEGEFSHPELNAAQAQKIQLCFIHSHENPHYALTKNNQTIFGQLNQQNDKLIANIHAADDIFNELKKNLIEYADIEGIHIVVSLELASSTTKDEWDIVELDYAMKGDR